MDNGDGNRALRVLIVDDNREAADTLRELLDLCEFEARAVYGGIAALASIANWQPDVALLDIRMPDLDGETVARRVREGARGALGDGTRRPLPLLVALTGGLTGPVAAEAATFDHVLTKPVSLEDLLRVLDPSQGRPARCR